MGRLSTIQRFNGSMVHVTEGPDVKCSAQPARPGRRGDRGGRIIPNVWTRRPVSISIAPRILVSSGAGYIASDRSIPFAPFSFSGFPEC